MAGMPGDIGARFLLRARTARAVSFVVITLIFALVLMIGFQALADRPLWLAWCGFVLVSVATLAPHFMRERFGVIIPLAILLVVPGIAAIAYELPRQSGAPWWDEALLTMMKLAALMLGVVARSAVATRVTLVTVLLLCEATIVLVAFQQGFPLRIDAVTLLLALHFFAVSFNSQPSHRGQALPKPTSQIGQMRAAEHWRQAVEDVQAKVVGSLHDTVLGTLLAIGHSKTGPVRPTLREAAGLEAADIESGRWIGAHVHADPAEHADEEERWLSSGLFQAIAEWQRKGLVIDVTGQTHIIAGLSPAADHAVGLAVRQCLANVQRHAGTQRAEISLNLSGDEVIIGVVDEGKGFSVDMVAADRIGLRHSIERRIASVGGRVRVWSSPGAGTLVLLRLPVQKNRTVARIAETVQRLDPVGTVLHWPISVIAVIIAVAVPVVSLLFHGVLRAGPLAWLSVLCFAIAGAVLLVCSSARYGPYSTGKHLLVAGAALAAVILAMVDPTRTPFVEGLSWAPISAGLLLFAAAAFRPPLHTAVETLLVGIVTVYLAESASLTRAGGVITDTALASGLFAAYPITVLGLSSAAFAAATVIAARHWQREAVRAARESTEFVEAARRVVQDRWRPMLYERVAPFLLSIAAGEELTSERQAYALHLAQDLRERLLEIAQDRFLVELFTELGYTNAVEAADAADPENRTMWLTASQRTAVAVCLRVLFADPAVRKDTFQVSILPVSPRETAVQVRVEVDEPTARLATRNSATFLALHSQVQDLVWRFDRPMLEVRFRFGADDASGR